MALRVPPGRTGRLWLLRRLEVARRGAEVLEQKRGTLLRERLLLAAELAKAQVDWERKATAASAWNARALTAAGPRGHRLVALHVDPATVEVARRNVIGVVIPLSVRMELGPPPEAGAVIRLSADAHHDALLAAAALASVQAAHEAIEAELRSTVRRLRAIERRWIPEHEAELHRLELQLDETELADVARARWAAGRQR
jgi:V/A-type H+-transporting ATPase subunit D